MEQLQTRLCLGLGAYRFRRKSFVRVLMTLLFCASGDVAWGELWTRKGPPGGNVQAMAIDPANPAIIYAGTDGGLFKSTDGGNHWNEINIGLTPTDVRALAIDPKNPTTVYAGTNGGVFKSTDRGNNWTEINIGLTVTNVIAVAIDPASPNIVYAGTSGGLFKSVDGGAKWTPTAFMSDYIQAIAIDPSAPATLFVIVNSLAVFKTLDGGATWADLGINPVDTFDFIAALVIDPITPTTICLSIGGYPFTSFTIRGVYKSTDGGVTWTFTGIGRDDFSISAFTIDPITPTILYAGTDTGNVLKTVNGGVSWSSGSDGLIGSSVNVMTIDRTTVTTIYAGTRDGVFKTANGGINWREIDTGLNAAPVLSLALDATLPNNLYVGTRGAARGGVFKSKDAADTWTATPLGNAVAIVDPFALAVDPITPTTIYAVSGNYGVFKSIDGGESWSATANLTSGPAQAVAIDPVMTSTLYVGTCCNVFKSSDGGQSWRNSLGLGVRALAIDPITPRTVYAGAGIGVFKSIDRGESWTPMVLFDGVVLALVIDRVTATTLYAGTSGTSGGVYKSIDGGVTWRTTNVGLTTTDIHALVIDPITPTTLYAGTNIGVFKSINGGENWTPINTGLSATDVRALGIDPSNPTIIYAGTNGGVFKTTSVPWTFCGNENQFCSFTGTKLVRYGAGTSFNFLTATNGINCNNSTFGDPIVGTVKHCDYQDASPQTSWTFCANENQSCLFRGPKLVRYGAGTTFNFQIATDGIACNNGIFGDPIVGTVKHCDYSDISTSWTFCANENQSCLFNGTKLVRYGAGTSFSLLTATNGVSCNNATFGDPILGVVKRCEYSDL